MVGLLMEILATEAFPASDETAIRSLFAGARELSPAASQELARRITEFVLLECQIDTHDLDSVGRDRFVGAVRSVAEMLGDVPTTTSYEREYKRRRELGDTSLPSVSAVVKHFGSWPMALAQSGLAPTPPPRPIERLRKRRGRHVPGYPSTRMIECLQACARDLGRPPAMREYTVWRDDMLDGRRGARPPGSDIPHANTIMRRYGGWLPALVEAGFDAALCTRRETRSFSNV